MKPITNTFVLIAPDSPTEEPVVPRPRGSTPTVPSIQYELLTGHPYRFTLEELILATHVRRLGLSEAEAKAGEAALRAELFAKPHPCMRASALTKTHGWGVHHDAEGRMALHGVGSDSYRRLAEGEGGVEVVVSMRRTRPGKG